MGGELRAANNFNFLLCMVITKEKAGEKDINFTELNCLLLLHGKLSLQNCKKDQRTKPEKAAL